MARRCALTVCFFSWPTVIFHATAIHLLSGHVPLPSPTLSSLLSERADHADNSYRCRTTRLRGCMVMTARSAKYIGVYGGTTSLLAWLEASLPGASVCQFSQSQECLQRLSHEPCDLLIVDLNGRLAEGLDVIVKARQTVPWLCSIAIIKPGNTSAAIRVMKAGACDCLERPVGNGRWKEAIQTQLRRVEASELYPCRTLTPTEVQVLYLMLADKTNREMARALHRSQRTVETHRQHIMRKLNTSSKVSLVKRVCVRGLPWSYEWDTAIGEERS